MSGQCANCGHIQASHDLSDGSCRSCWTIERQGLYLGTCTAFIPKGDRQEEPSP